MKTSSRTGIVVLLGLSTFTACGGGGGGPTPPPLPPPTAATINGYTVPAPGQARFSVSALTADNRVIATGTISNPTISNLNAGAGTATVCGQIVAQGPVVCGITIDATGSMSGTDPTGKRADAAKTFIGRLTPSDQAAVSSFSTTTVPTPPYTTIKVEQGLTADKALLTAAVDRATRANGQTPLWGATRDTVNLVAAAPGTNRVALVFTDGQSNSGPPLSAALSEAKAKGVKLFMVGLGAPNSLDVADMQRAAFETGGLYASVSAAADLQTLFDRVFNATQAAGCIEVRFSPVPPAGTTISGTLSFQVTANGVTITPSASFSVQF